MTLLKKIFFKNLSNRLTLQECIDHKLFNLSVANSKKRENILFLSEKLKCFSHEFAKRF